MSRSGLIIALIAIVITYPATLLGFDLLIAGIGDCGAKGNPVYLIPGGALSLPAMIVSQISQSPFIIYGVQFCYYYMVCFCIFALARRIRRRNA